jgi:uncharacterized SAM-binding protein YcdF (DUF218 family)
VLDPSLGDPYWWRALAKTLVLPPAGPLIVALAGFALMPRRPRAGRALVIGGVLAMLLLSMPFVGALLLRTLEVPNRLDAAQLSGARAIVILGGGVRHHAPEYGGDTLGRLSLERVRYGARVAKTTALPVLVSGGTTVPEIPTEASLMRAALENEFGVPVRWVEDQSRSTHENAQLSAAILKAEGIDRIVLVAHGFDMPRAIAEFADAGVTAIPAATGISTGTTDTLADFVPSLPGLTSSYYAIYELLGGLARRLRVALPP